MCNTFSRPEGKDWPMAFVCKGEEIAGKWINVPNVKLYCFCSSQNIISMIKLKGLRSACGIDEICAVCKILAGKPEANK
jgi:hypothetical protein